MSDPFTVIVPVLVTDSNLVSTTATEDDYLAYDAGTTYAMGDRVIVTTGYHGIYQSLIDANTGNFPPSNPTKWVLVGPTNAWAAFDESGGTITTVASPLTFVVNGDLATSIGLLEVDAATARIQAYNATEGTYYDQTIELQDRTVVGDWFDYFFSEINRQAEVIVTDIPPVSSSVYTITLGSLVDVSLGTFVMGKATRFGFIEYNAQAGIIDYSRKDVNEFGRATLEKRAYSNRMNVNIHVANGLVDSVKKKMATLRATPCLWVAAKGQYELLTIFGFYRDFTIDIAYPSYSVCTAEIEGLS